VEIRRVHLTSRLGNRSRTWHRRHARRALSATVLLFVAFMVSSPLLRTAAPTSSIAGSLSPTALKLPAQVSMAQMEFQAIAELHGVAQLEAFALQEAFVGLQAAAAPPPAPTRPVVVPVATVTKAPNPPAPAQPAVDSSGAAAWAASAGVACIRARESGDNYGENSGNGYYGAYQDLLSTWESHGGTGLPSDAPPAVQDQINYEIYLSGGWGQWGTAAGCGL
jgi:hypothetical protein